jgi:hypothetical protein
MPCVWSLRDHYDLLEIRAGRDNAAQHMWFVRPLWDLEWNQTQPGMQGINP